MFKLMYSEFVFNSSIVLELCDVSGGVKHKAKPRSSVVTGCTFFSHFLVVYWHFPITCDIVCWIPVDNVDKIVNNIRFIIFY